MASPIEAVVILCDAAQVDQAGKVHMLGAGWSVTSSPTGPSAVAILIDLPWDRTNEVLHLVLELVDPDGKPIQLETVQGSTGIRVEADIEVGRPPGVASGSSINAALAPGFPPLPLLPGRYIWRVAMGDQQWSRAFTVR